MSRDGVPYTNTVLSEEHVGVEVLRRPHAIEMVITLRPPRPSSSFEIADAVVLAETDASRDLYQIVARAHEDIRKHASELRWNCMETFLRKDAELGRVDVARVRDVITKHADQATCERLALELMAHVERLGK